MKAGLRQRVVGAIVLTSLAIIILPLLLDGSREDRARVVTDIPDAPNFDIQEIAISDLTRNIQQMGKDSAAQLPEETIDETDYSEMEAYALDNNHLPVAWSLQFGSFMDRKNAVKLRAELRDAQYRSYILQHKTDEGDAFKVLVGPMMDRKALEKTSQEIKSRMQLEGHIIRYRVEDDATQLGG